MLLGEIMDVFGSSLNVMTCKIERLWSWMMILFYCDIDLLLVYLSLQ